MPSAGHNNIVVLGRADSSVMQSARHDNIRTLFGSIIGKRGNFSKKMVWLILMLLLIVSWITISDTTLSAIGGRLAKEPNSYFTVGRFSSPTAVAGIEDRLKPFCQPWSSSDAFNRTLQPFDRWYTHHPSWFVVEETDDRFCVAPGDGTIHHPHVGNLLQIYANQFHRSCKTVHVRPMWSSGWGADFLNVQAGMVHAMTGLGGVPLVMSAEEHAWHYAANKDDASNPTCPAADASCYFLPHHGCGPLAELRASSEILDAGDIPADSGIHENPGLGRSAYFFFTRGQLWLRRAVFDYAQEFKRENGISPARYSDCTVVHVRRSDVILHAAHARRYFPVEDYVAQIPPEKLADPNHYIFLLTDDANAVDEALEFFPGLAWKYLDRPRHRGSSGGWENQTPSRDPRLETVVLLATFELAKDCSAIVHGHSNLATYIYQQMRLYGRHDDVKIFRVDKGNVYDPAHNTSEVELEKMLQELRLHNDTDRQRRYQVQKMTPKTAMPRDDKQEQAVGDGHVDDDDGDDDYYYDEDGSLANEASNMASPGGEDCTADDIKGIIVVNVLGLLANNLFEAAFAKRMASELGCGWHVIYRTTWNPAFPTARTDVCFPHLLVSDSNRRHRESGHPRDRTKQAIRQIGANGFNSSVLHGALTYNQLEPGNNRGRDDVDALDRANNLTLEWIHSFGEKALRIEHLEYPLQADNVDELVSKLRDPSSQVKVLSLEAFFIHFDWMSDWMDRIADWLRINPSCCATAAPPKNAIMIHVREFAPEEEDKDKYLEAGVYRDIVERYSNLTKEDREVIIVCQPKSVKTDLVRALVKEFSAEVRTGTDNIDAFCLLSSAQGMLIPTTSSSFSEMAALLAEQKNHNVQVHYPIHTLNQPAATLKVPTWKYHLVDKKRVLEFDVDHDRLKVTQA